LFDHPPDVTDGREIFTSNSRDGKAAALSFAPERGHAHAAAWKCELHRVAES